MKLFELNNSQLLEQDFTKVSDELEIHIDKLENDIKEVNLNIVRLMTNKAYKVLDMLTDTIKSKTSILTLGEKVDKYSKQLNILKKRFITFRTKFSDNKFEKEIMDEVDTILAELIEKIGDAIDDGDKAVKDLSDEISLSSVPKANRKRKVPIGIAQDLKTRKTFVNKD